LPETKSKKYILPSGETKEEISNFLLKYIDSIVEFDENSKLIAKNITITNGAIASDYVQLNTELSTPPTDVGAIYWDDQDKTVTANMEPSNGGGVKLQIGQEMYIRATNKTGTTISNGEVVFISGAQGNRPTIDLADSGSYENATRVIGVATEDIGNNLFGYVTTEGLVRDLNTSDYTDGECVFVGTVSGSFTTVTPTFGDARVKVGIITKAHPTDGWLKVCVANDKYMFGDVDGGNYSGFEDDGTLRFVGDATVWRDENAGGVSLTKANSNQPDLVTIDSTNILSYAFDGVNSLEELHWANELQHDWKIDSDIQPHIHFYTTDTGTGDVKWNLQYWISNGGTATFTSSTSLVQTVNGNAWEQFRVDFDEAITGTDASFSAQMHFRVWRDPNDAADTYGSDVVIGTLGYHYEIDTVGSRQITTK
jgi:hypothetical protein